MASEPIRSTSVVAAPKDYSIPQAQQIRLLSVQASFIDATAGGDWLPALQILDNNGNVLVTAADSAVKVTAGGSADVSWFPGVKVAAAASGSSATAFWEGTGSQNVNSAALTNLNTDEYEADSSGAVVSAQYAAPLAGAQLTKVGMYVIQWQVSGRIGKLTGGDFSAGPWLSAHSGIYAGGWDVSDNSNPATNVNRVFSGLGWANIEAANVGVIFHLTASTSVLTTVLNKISILYLGPRAA